MGYHGSGQFFRSFADVGGDNRILVVYDSKSLETQSTDQGTAASSILRSWRIPNLGDGSPGVVGWSGIGQRDSSGLGRLFNSLSGATHGWTLNSRRWPGGMDSSGSNPNSTPWSDGSSQNCMTMGADYTIATGAARTAYGAEPTLTGVLLACFPSHHIGNNSASFGGLWCMVPPGLNPFGSRQTRLRWIYHGTGATNGPTDMRIMAVRQLDSSSSFSANNTALLAKTTMDLSGTGVAAYDVDAGAGVGTPGFLIINPAAPAGAVALRVYSLGSRAFRDSAGVPIVGTNIAAIAASGFNINQHASCMGMTGYTGHTPDPYCSETKAKEYVRLMCGRGTGNDGPNKVIIYTRHNFTATQLTALAAGDGAEYQATHEAVIAKYQEWGVALNGGVAPDILVVGAEPVRESRTLTFVNTARQALMAACRNRSVEFCDLFDEFPGGDGSVTDFSSLTTEYGKANQAPNVAGSGSGPVASSVDYVHPSLMGGDFIWGRAFDMGMAKIGLERDPRTLTRVRSIGRSRQIRSLRA